MRHYICKKLFQVRHARFLQHSALRDGKFLPVPNVLLRPRPSVGPVKTILHQGIILVNFEEKVEVALGVERQETLEELLARCFHFHLRRDTKVESDMFDKGPVHVDTEFVKGVECVGVANQRGDSNQVVAAKLRCTKVAEVGPDRARLAVRIVLVGFDQLVFGDGAAFLGEKRVKSRIRVADRVVRWQAKIGYLLVNPLYRINVDANRYSRTTERFERRRRRVEASGLVYGWLGRWVQLG